MRRTVMLAASIALVGPTSVANAATISVNTTTDEYGTGSACSLREAIQAANGDAAFGGCPAGAGDDLIMLPAGTYTLSIGGTGENANATGDLDITSDVAIQGAGALVTAVDGGGLDRVFDVDPSSAGVTASISGLTVRGGKTASPDDGGGIQNRGILTLTKMAITGNEAFDDAGGILNLDLAAVLIAVDSAISENAALGTGVFTGDGGGMRNTGSATATLTNVTISGNTAEELGGGIDRLSGPVTLNNVTVTANTVGVGSVPGDGGGLSGDVTIRNTIIARNTDAMASPTHAPDCSGAVTSQGYNLVGDSTGCTFTASTGDQVGTGAAPIDPVLGPLAGNGGPTRTHALLAGSPAVDGGNPGGCPDGTNPITTDQRGLPRPVDGDQDGTARCDIGAYEHQVAAKQVRLKARPRRVEAGERTRLRATITPCVPETQNDTVQFRKGKKVLAEKAVNDACRAKKRVKVKRRTKYRAFSPGDFDSTADVSKKVTVKVRD